jgi:hypothetical protein
MLYMIKKWFFLSFPTCRTRTVLKNYPGRESWPSTSRPAKIILLFQYPFLKKKKKLVDSGKLYQAEYIFSRKCANMNVVQYKIQFSCVNSSDEEQCCGFLVSQKRKHVTTMSNKLPDAAYFCQFIILNHTGTYKL